MLDRLNEMNGAFMTWKTYPMTSSPSTHIAPGWDERSNFSRDGRKGTDLVLEGEKIVIEQDGRQCCPIVL